MLDARKKIALTDSNGSFRLESIPVGRQSLRISYIGYKSITLSNLMLTRKREVF